MEKKKLNSFLKVILALWWLTSCYFTIMGISVLRNYDGIELLGCLLLGISGPSLLIATWFLLLYYGWNEDKTKKGLNHGRK